MDCGEGLLRRNKREEKLFKMRMLPQTMHSAVHRPLACDKKYSLCLYDLLQSVVGEEGSKVGQGGSPEPPEPRPSLAERERNTDLAC